MDFDKINKLLSKQTKLNSSHLNTVITDLLNGIVRIRFNYNVLRNPQLSKIVHYLQHSNKSYWYGKVYLNDKRIKLESITDSMVVFEVSIDDFKDIVMNNNSQSFDSRIIDSYKTRLKLLIQTNSNDSDKVYTIKYRLPIAKGQEVPDERIICTGKLSDKLIDIMSKDTYWYIDFGDTVESDFNGCVINYYNCGNLTLEDIFTLHGTLLDTQIIYVSKLYIYDKTVESHEGDNVNVSYALSDYGSGDSMYFDCDVWKDTLATLLEKDGYTFTMLFDDDHYCNGMKIYRTTHVDGNEFVILNHDKLLYDPFFNLPFASIPGWSELSFDISAA